MAKKQIVSPISIDLGARNTGVYSAHYPANSSLEDIEKEGKVYQLEKDNHTLLMANRTATRHQRRGFDRRQMAKRLFRLIWCRHFKLPWDDTIQQGIGFLLNRRGFSFLTEEYDAEVLREFPKTVFNELPDSIKNEFGTENSGNLDFASKLTEWANDGEGKVKFVFNELNREPDRIHKRQVVIVRAEKLQEYCETRLNGALVEEKDRARIKLAKLSNWILNTWKNEGMKGLERIHQESHTVDVVDHLNREDVDVEAIKSSIPNYVSEKEELKESVWKFASDKFDSDKVDFGTDEEPNIRTHLHHLTFALYKVHEELTSGGRHRSKYFEEIEKVLTYKEHTHGYLKTFCTRLHADGFAPLNVEKLTNLIGHLSNLELKPLRKYFNDKAHQNGDYWDEKRLEKVFGRWILHEWRVNSEKDKEKVEGKPGDYKKLCQDWKAHQGTVVDFWLKTDPFCTIPPYQDNNNRRPPRCQSLILNPTFLDNHYPEWKKWLRELKELETVQGHLGNFEEELNKVESGKGRSYFSDEAKGELRKDSGRRTLKDLNARLLQFIFDWVKADDPLLLNEMYSHAKKYRQQQSTTREKEEAKGRLEEAIEDSQLPDTLRTSRDYQNDAIFREGSFLHLVCNYYKLRQKARAGRVFIHPEYRFVKGRGYENTGRFDARNHLLTYCNHKPRQKRYQSFYDVAGVLQVSPEKLQELIGSQDDDALVEWLKSFPGLPTVCKKAADAQKEHRGALKAHIDTAVKKRDKKNPLYKLNESVEKIAWKIGEVLFGTIDNAYEKRRKIQEQKIEKFRSVFSFAQINNIAFTERSGNANTCAVCSTDNAQRMQMVASANGKESHAKAQHLPAIATRLIDGAVMRMARIVGSAIAEDKWQKIEDELQAGNQVRVPLITESNRFEFEPSKEELVKSQRRKSRKGKPLERGGEQAFFDDKEERLREAGGDICPYTGTSIGNRGEIDHIIPRSSERGTLNDEANLIYASNEGNQTKGEQTYSLSKLHNDYKHQQFGTTDDAEITKWIEDQIGDGEGELFKFGQYRSFINLTSDQQKAFRHALFLENHPLREKVINAINNRNRTLVNGTQRYFAEVLANSLYKKAKAIGKQHLLSFDYFGVEAQDSSRGDGIYHLRKAIEAADSEIKKYKKVKGKTQELYSHLIDAQLAFAMVADEHRNEGGLKLRIDNPTSLWPVNRTAANTIFNTVRVAPEEIRKSNLERRKPDKDYFSHRSIHRDSMYAEHYIPILVDKETGEVRIGFDWKNSYALKDKKPTRINLYFALQFSPLANSLHLTTGDPFTKLAEQLANAGCNSEARYFYITLSVQSVHAYYPKTYNTSKGYRKYSTQMKFLRSLAYRTEKKRITALSEAEKILGKETNFQTKQLTLPIKADWQHLVDEWRGTDLEDTAFLRRFFKIPDNKKSHEKVRKVFSLPIKTGEGKILLKRNSWDGKDIFQIVNDSDSRKIDAKVFIPVFVKSEDKIGRLLSESARSEGVFLLSEDDNKPYYNRLDSNIAIIDPKHWHPIETEETRKELRKLGVQKLAYRIDNNTRPQIRLTFREEPQQKKIDVIVEHVLLKPKDKENLHSLLREVGEQGGRIEYTGTGFPSDVQHVLFPVLAADYQ